MFLSESRLSTSMLKKEVRLLMSLIHYSFLRGFLNIKKTDPIPTCLLGVICFNDVYILLCFVSIHICLE